jgi:hypothetical protein
VQLEIEIEHMHKIGSSAVEISETEIFYKDKSFIFQSVVFDSQSKSMVIQKRDVTNRKGKSRMEINFRKIQPSQISLFHQVTGDALHDSNGGIEAKNARVRERLNEFEQDFIATPEFSIPLAKNVPSTTAAKMKVSSTARYQIYKRCRTESKC